MPQQDQAALERAHQLLHSSHDASNNIATGHVLPCIPHPTVDSERTHHRLKPRIIPTRAKSLPWPCLCPWYFRPDLCPLSFYLIRFQALAPPSQDLSDSYICHWVYWSPSHLCHLQIDEQTLSIFTQVLDKKSLGGHGHLPLHSLALLLSHVAPSVVQNDTLSHDSPGCFFSPSDPASQGV